MELRLKAFPTEATFYISNDEQSYTKIGVASCEVTNKVLLYTFAKPYSFSYFRYEFTEANAAGTKHANASEFILLKPEESEVVAVRELFTDYKKSVIKSEYANSTALTKLKSSVQDKLIYESILEPNINRAFQILAGELSFSVAKREFSVSDSATKPIRQIGSISAYRKELKHTWEGTDRQATGIFANPGEEITIYVEADANDPLPQICFTQFISSYAGWYSTKDLVLGENKFVVPNLYKDSYASYGEAIPGGPLYIINPYDASQQSGNLRIYIEGGEDFPIYYMGANQYDFKDDLANYLEKYQADRSRYHNLCEIVSNNIILTIQATRADYFYNQQNYDVEETCQNWDKFVRAIHEFDGVSLDEKSPYYDPRVAYYNINIRIMVPYGSAYAYIEHIGIQIGAWQDNAIKGQNLGWGYAHEIGHMLAMSEREIAEVTNNMPAQYNKAYVEGTGANGNTNTFMNYFLADDESLRKTYNDLPLIEKSLLWWNIETMYPGYWGRLNNLYRYGNAPSDLSKIEKHVYFSSLATGVDMSYYFIRTGFDVWGNFNETTFSETFIHAMTQLKETGQIKVDERKIWYFDAMSATYYNQDGETALTCYNNDMQVEILQVSKTSAGYLIVLPDQGANKAHLGYEIYQKNSAGELKLLGFTYTNTFTDSTSSLEGEEPSYYIKAYDRRLNSTALSNTFSNSDTDVCRIGSVYYDSLKTAVKNATSGATIYLLKDIKEDNIIIDKDVIITIAPTIKNNITLAKLTNENMFIVNSGVKLTLSGNKDYNLCVEGNNTLLNGRLIYSNGSLELNYIEVNNINSNLNDGGLIYSESAGSVLINNSIFNNIKAKGKGGVLYNKTISLTITNSSFTNNYAKEGGVLYSYNANIIIDNSSFIGNSAQSAGVASTDADNNHIFKVSAIVTNSIFKDNNTSYLAGLIFTYTKWQFQDSTFTNNSAKENGGLVYT